ncbi:hypothetical protein ACWEMJ_25585, partial [Kitasatospora sp. NPDC004531]
MTTPEESPAPAAEQHAGTVAALAEAIRAVGRSGADTPADTPAAEARPAEARAAAGRPAAGMRIIHDDDHVVVIDKPV